MKRPALLDKEVFCQIYLQYHGPLCQLAERMVGDANESQDIVEDVFLKLWEKKRHFNDYDHVKAFLYRSIRNSCLDTLKKTKRALARHIHFTDTYCYATEDYLAAVTHTEVIAQLYGAIADLSAQAAEVIRKTYIEGKSNQEVAEEMQLSMQTVKNHKYRGLSILRRKLSREGLLLLLAASLM